MAPKGVKASKILQRKTKVKVIDWVPRERARGTIYTPIELGTSRNQRTRRKNAVRMETDDEEVVLHEDDLPSMDVDDPVDETWMEEPDVPTQRRVRLLACPSIMPLDIAFSPSVHLWKSLFPELVNT
jgi:hypothetical protein